MQNIFMTGANRGLGLEMVRQYVAQGERVFAACRIPEKADALRQLALQYPDQVVIVQLEVTDQTQIDSSVEAVSAKTESLDIVINNAGINPPRAEQTLETITAAMMLHVLNVNAVASLMVSKAFVRLLKPGHNPRLVQISSQLGSLERKTSGGTYAYTTSKAAMNMVARALAGDLAQYGITTVTMHPGWVQTDMGGASASLTPEESARGVMNVIAGLKPSDNGKFFQWDGTLHAW